MAKHNCFRQLAGVLFACIKLMPAVFIHIWLMPAHAQDCPPNLDFEKGSFDGWKCYTGYVEAINATNVFNLTESGGPIDFQHAIINASTAQNDPYGGFSTRPPNGSEYCIKLGNNTGGGEAEAISYEFTIPANREVYSLIYHYAVVFQDPDHEEYQQPRMEIEITNLTTHSQIDCSSFTFVPFGSPLPGFFQSDIVENNTPIWCKDWTAVTINLDGMAGNLIRLTFRTSDCTFRRHFGYAYIDVDTDCSGELPGASFCPYDKDVTVTAPYGFQYYTWYSSDMTRVLGNGQSLSISPVPAPGTVVKVQLTPYNGYGCQQTLTAKLEDDLTIVADAGRDTVSCNLTPVRIGSAQKPGLIYTWWPEGGLSNYQSANPFARPTNTTQYILNVRSPGGGCYDNDTVTVVASNIENSLQLLGKKEYCIGNSDSTVFLITANITNAQWYKDGIAVPGATGKRFLADATGTYYAELEDVYGCQVKTDGQAVIIASVPQASFAVNFTEQCLDGNSFRFNSTSTNAVGQMQYQWNIGGIAQLAVPNPTYSFSKAGTYSITLTVSSNSVCLDSVQTTITVHQNPVPEFDAAAICTNLPFLPVNKTSENIGSPIRYQWLYDNLPYSVSRDPLPRFFTNPGNHSITLQVSSEQCPLPLQVLTKSVVVDAPTPAKRYSTAFAIRNVPLLLEARPVGQNVLWHPAFQLDNPEVYKPRFSGAADQDYLITLTTAGGCVTVDSLLVQIVEKADIIVPTAFSPNGDGLNDLLRPVPIGIAEIRYFRIFNRWGQLLYESRNPKEGWNGRINGVIQQSQTVVWMAEGIGIDGTQIVKKGTTVLVR